MTVNGKAVTAVFAGMLFVWSGVKGWSILGTAGDLITGIKPQQTSTPLTDPNAAQDVVSSGIGSAGGNDLATIAESYTGHAYLFGGAPGADGSRPWDCSSFVNFVVSIRMGKAIPGYAPGRYRGNVHGPPTGTWAVWNGLQRVSRNNVTRGDIIVWSGHMGIALSNSRLVSALNPRAGTKETGIEGTGRGPIVTMGRLK